MNLRISGEYLKFDNDSWIKTVKYSIKLKDYKSILINKKLYYELKCTKGLLNI